MPSILIQHNIENFKKCLKVLKKGVLMRALILSDVRILALEKKKQNDQTDIIPCFVLAVARPLPPIIACYSSLLTLLWLIAAVLVSFDSYTAVVSHRLQCT